MINENKNKYKVIKIDKEGNEVEIENALAVIIEDDGEYIKSEVYSEFNSAVCMAQAISTAYAFGDRLLTDEKFFNNYMKGGLKNE